MSDIFTIEEISLTKELGMLIKNFRIENKVTARSIIDEFNKSSSYISKLEKGEIKKIKTDFLNQLCNFITKNDRGIKELLMLGAQKSDTYTPFTKNIISNIDELVIEHTIPNDLVIEINNYMQDKNITTENLINMINRNQDLEQYEIDIINKIPYNQWYYVESLNNDLIKISMPLEYLNSFLSSNLETIHLVIIEVILYTLYLLGQEKDARNLADSKLKFYKIKRYSSTVLIKVTDKNIDELFGGMPDVQIKALKQITTGLKLISIINKDIGLKKLQQINDNLHVDLAFYFAYISQDLTELEKQSVEVKQQFLKDLKELIEKTVNQKKEITQPNLTDYL
ncbi:hypothetical protein [Anaerovorax odorimutans]|uniref:hypothetical protein n=1 Tax=Anaerovorax odorimutans TaxID=109327 RepID=UPI0004163E2C|nr:hypothetical protein [Anaerovorax odorimutans]